MEPDGDDRGLGGGPEEALQEVAWRMAAARCLEEIIHSWLGVEISFSGGSGSRDQLETSPHHHDHCSLNKEHHVPTSTR
jgi:hypothetical protein